MADSVLLIFDDLRFDVGRDQSGSVSQNCLEGVQATRQCIDKGDGGCYEPRIPHQVPMSM